MNDKLKDALAVAIGIGCLLLVVAIPVLYFFAPCDWLGWVPAANTPGRCVGELLKP